MPTFKLWLGIAVVGSLIGIAYSNWNQSMQFGNIKVLILATYFIPILSSVMSIPLSVKKNPLKREDFFIYVGTVRTMEN